MVRKLCVSVCLVVAVLLSAALAASPKPSEVVNPFLGDKAVGEYLQAISVNVKAGYAQGSGTIFTINIEGQRAHFILTAAHVVESLRRTRTYHEEGTEKTAIYYDDAQISQEQLSEGRIVGKVVYDAKVINVDQTRDIALLLVRKRDAFDVTGFFYPHDLVPVGTRVLHCGAPGGIEIGGTASLTNGIVSRIGVKITDYTPSEYAVFDQVTCPALGGSSGGLVAVEENGCIIGILTMGLRGSDNFNWIVPVRMIRKWAKDIGAEWLFDPNRKITEADLEKIPLETGKVGRSKSEGRTISPPTYEIVPRSD